MLSNKRQCIRDALGELEKVKDDIDPGVYNRIEQSLMEVNNSTSDLYMIEYVHAVPVWSTEKEQIVYTQTTRKSIVPLTNQEYTELTKDGHGVNPPLWRRIAARDGTDLPHLEHMWVDGGLRVLDTRPLPETVVLIGVHPFSG